MGSKQLICTNQSLVRKHCGRSENDVEQDIQILKKWLQGQTHLPEIPTDHMIEVFLIANKFSIEKTKSRLDMYYTMRGLIPEMYKHPCAPEMQSIFDIMYNVPLPKLTKDLNRVTITRLKDCGTENYNIQNFLAHQLNILEIRIQEDFALGEVFVYDYEHLKMAHVIKWTPMDIKKGATILEKVFSNRLKGIHMINAPPFIDIMLSLGKSVLKPKLANRMFVHKTLESFYEYVPKSILPKDYGGEEMSMNELNDLWKLKLTTENKTTFDKLEKLKVNETLRPDPLTNSDVLGYHGNFKKLDVD